MASQLRTSASLTGQIIAQTYRVEEPIGAGGMGTVYRAVHLPSGQEIALKTLSIHDATPETIARFERESQTAQQLHHPNTVRIFESGRSHDTLFIVMELLHGQPLSAALQRGPIHSTRARHILSQLLQSLTEAHARGVIHRDLKPDNIFLCQHDEDPDFVKVLDFGLAKLTSLPPQPQPTAPITLSGSLFGTPAYMSPEQARSEPLDPRSDLYACGVLAFEMLTGHVPFLAEEPMGTLLRHCTDPIPPIQAPDTPKELRNWVRKALAKHPEERFSCADHMLQELRQIDLHATPTAVHPFQHDLSLDLSREQQLPRTPSRPNPIRSFLLPIGLFAVAAVILAAVVLLSSSTTPPLQEAIAATPQSGAASVALPKRTPKPTPSPTTSNVSIHIQSSPPGAQIFHGDDLLGTAPLTIQRPQNPKEALALTLRKDGFQPFTSTLFLNRDSSLQADLEPHSAKPTPTTPPNPSARPRKKRRSIPSPARGFANPYQ